MVDGAVGMRQLIPERNDGRDVGDLRRENRPMLHSDAESLASSVTALLIGRAGLSAASAAFTAGSIAIGSPTVRNTINRSRYSD